MSLQLRSRVAHRQLDLELDVPTGETLALPETAQDEFSALLARCRHRDRIAAALPGTPP